MAKRKRSPDEKVIDRRRKEGRGYGRGANYKPWLRIQDVPSQGLVTRICGWKTGRIHHLLSKLELFYFLTLEWTSEVIDIREQFPLDLEETLAIAKDLGVTHPVDRNTKYPSVRTADFLITTKGPVSSNDHARTTKYVKDLSERQMELFEIERVYLALRSITWGIVTEEDIDFTLAENVKWVHPYRDISRHKQLTNECVRRVETVLAPQLMNEKKPLSALTADCDNKLGLKTGMSLAIVRHLIANRRLQPNMKNLIEPRKILTLNSIPTILLPQ